MADLVFLIALLFPPELDVTRLIAELGHPRFAIRELATQSLFAIAPKRALLKATKSPDPEISQRAKTILSAIVERELARLKPLPEIDAAWWNTTTHTYESDNAPPDMKQCFREAAGHTRGYDHTPYPQFYAATEIWTRKQLITGASESFMRIILADLHRRDADFLGRTGGVSSKKLVVDHEKYRASR